MRSRVTVSEDSGNGSVEVTDLVRESSFKMEKNSVDSYY